MALVFMAFTGCKSRPNTSRSNTSAGIVYRVYDVRPGSEVGICDNTTTADEQGQAVLTVPYSCEASPDLPLRERFDSFTPIELKGVANRMRGKGLFQKEETDVKAHTFTQQMDYQEFVVAWLSSVKSGEEIELAGSPKSEKTVVWISTESRMIHKILGPGTRVGDVDFVAVAKSENPRNTGRNCFYDRAIAKLDTYDLAMEVYDARKAKLVSKKLIVSENPACPSSIYTEINNSSPTTTAGPNEGQILMWLHEIRRGAQ